MRAKPDPLILVKSTHTLIWAFFAGCILALPVAVFTDRRSLALLLIGIVSVEVLWRNTTRPSSAHCSPRTCSTRRSDFGFEGKAALRWWVVRPQLRHYPQAVLQAPSRSVIMRRWCPMLVSRCWTVGVALLAFVPAAAVAQAPDGTAPGGWIDPSWTELRVSVDRAKEEEPPRSAGHTILLHTAVGTGTGLLVGLVFAGSTLTDDNTEVLLIWTAAGAAAGAISGLVTWLVTRDKSD